MVKVMGFIDIMCGAIIGMFLIGLEVPVLMAIIFGVFILLKGVYSILSTDTL